MAHLRHPTPPVRFVTPSCCASHQGGAVDDLSLAVEFLKNNGFRVTGVTFDLVQPSDGLSGVGLLRDGREVRFFIPSTTDIQAVVGSPRNPAFTKGL